MDESDNQHLFPFDFSVFFPLSLLTSVFSDLAFSSFFASTFGSTFDFSAPFDFSGLDLDYSLSVLLFFLLRSILPCLSSQAVNAFLQAYIYFLKLSLYSALSLGSSLSHYAGICLMSSEFPLYFAAFSPLKVKKPFWGRLGGQAPSAIE